MADRLSAAAIRAHADVRWLGGRIECLDSVDSTNTHLRQLAAEGAGDGTVVLAEEQTGGRGRLGRTWVSPRGRNVYLSALLRGGVPVDRIPQISLCAGLAACETVEEWCAATLKWPNDVLAGGRKVVGILCEAQVLDAAPAVIVGVGINVNMRVEEFPAELRDKAGSLAHACGGEIDRCRVAGRLLSHLERRYDELRQVGFAAIAAEWTRRCGFLNRSIRVEEPGDIVEGEVLGLAADGALRLRRRDGSEYRVLAGDVTVLDGYAGGE